MDCRGRSGRVTACSPPTIDDVFGDERTQSQTPIQVLLSKPLAQLRQSELKTARAPGPSRRPPWRFSTRCMRSRRKHFRWWYNWAVRSRLETMKEKAAMLKRRFENIITLLATSMLLVKHSMRRSNG